jgi:2-isopropylmalate synthase
VEKLTIFDTTLRDGEQCPGASLNVVEKIEIARQLERLGVDLIEAGFPVSSPGDFEAVERISRALKETRVAGLARSLPKDIDAAYGALKKGTDPRIHVFLATSKIHMQYKLKKAESEILGQAVEAVRYARKKVSDVEFSPEDAARTDLPFLAKIVEAVIRAGAKTVNIPDTVGYSLPGEFGRIIRYLRENVPNIGEAVLSVHCHNDLGLAVANSLAAVQNGARQVECTVNGIGERAGNASLEEIVMAIKTRKDRFRGIRTGIKTRQIIKTSRLVSRLTSLMVQPNKAIVGANAFAHEAGIHQDGVLKHRGTYEIINPVSVGLSESMMVLGKHSGKHAFRTRLRKLGYELKEEALLAAFEQFKILADRKKVIYDEDLEALAEESSSRVEETVRLLYLNVSSATAPGIPTATVKIDYNGKVLEDAATGDGPVDAVYNAVERLCGIRFKLLDYKLKALTEGKDAMGEVHVKMQGPGKLAVSGRSSSTDIIVASAGAYLKALNKYLHKKAQQSGPAKKTYGI